MKTYDSAVAAIGPASGGEDAVEHPTPRRLVIVDPSPLRRDCLRAGLAGQIPNWRISEFESTAEWLRVLPKGASFPGVILLGGAVCRSISLRDLARIAVASPQTPVLATAECDDPERARMILRAGAKGFLPASFGLKVLVAALERLRAGGTFVPMMLDDAGRDATPSHTPADEPWLKVTRRQCDVLALISQGKSNKLIAEALGMSESTVKAHVKQILRRLQVANRTQAALTVMAHKASGPAAEVPRSSAEDLRDAPGDLANSD